MTEIRSKVSIHIPALDSLRGFAALSVCLYHFVCTTTGYIKSDIILNIFKNGQYGVQLFFVISGFIIPWSMYFTKYKPNNFFSFLLKRFLRLEPPYLFSLLIAITLLILRQRFYSNEPASSSFNFTQIFLHFGYLIPFSSYKWLNPVYWTLAVEFQYYLFIAFLYPLLIKSNIYTRIAVYCIIILLSFFEHPAFLLYWLPFFLLGIVIFLYKISIIGKQEYTIVIIGLATYCFFKYPPPMVLYAFAGVIMIDFFAARKVAIFSIVGKYSYSLYLLHTLIGATIINVLSHRFVLPWQKGLVILAGLAITLFFSWLMYLLIEKPSKKYSSGIKFLAKTADKTSLVNS